ncbi:AGAP000850-PA-like protein [Anopheles sinensis]|uniref:AGAP000850-PA-like protein n=1 Tax=Anopheles sinensis TaxID=74873 RepID=A0A084WFD7_ANOSI|nr:AGAP000850-PA-like protein [Anopheles sinensis]
MSHRNLTELFHMLRNNAVHSRSVSYENNSDNENLLETPGKSNDQPRWIGKYDEANYLLFKIRERIDEVRKLQSAEVRSVLSDENTASSSTTDGLIAEIKQLICTCHDNINSLRRAESGMEDMLLANIQRHCFVMLQGITEEYRKLLANKAARSLTESEGPLGLEPGAGSSSGATGSSSSSSAGRHHGTAHNSVETFDNFLQMEAETHGDDDQQLLDDFFQLPATGLTINQKQIMLIQADNTKMLKSREDEVLRMTNSITDLNVIFKDISKLIQEQGTILDRIDYNIESAQVRVSDGLRQLQKSESYQRKNKKIHCIMLLAMAIMFMIILIIFTKL